MMGEVLELQEVFEELKKQGVDVQIESTSEDLYKIIDGQGNGGCAQWTCSGGSGYRGPDDFYYEEKLAA